MSWTSDPPSIPGVLSLTAPDQHSDDVSMLIDGLSDDAKWKRYILSKLNKKELHSPNMSGSVGLPPTFSNDGFVEDTHALAQADESVAPSGAWSTDRARVIAYQDAYPYDFIHPVRSLNAGWEWATKSYVPDDWNASCRAWTLVDPPPVHTIIPSDAVEPDHTACR